MEIRFIKTNPTQNMTLLIQSFVPRWEQLETAQRLIAYDSVYAEQAGYIEEPESEEADARLQMMAGEFCGNATLSLAAYLFAKEMPQPGEKTTLFLEVSGAPSLLTCDVEKTETDFVGTVSMPLPLWAAERDYVLQGTACRLFTVAFDGIWHILVPASLWGAQAEAMAVQAAEAWAETIDAEAFGILLFDEESLSLRPLVCVKGSSLVWERGCGSGTAAVGVYLSEKRKTSLSLEIRQPGGVMGIQAERTENRISRLVLTGHVSIVAEGTAYL
ncbi:diaminopimelate epimerase [Anaerotignum lactatifermentans]|uniref:Diaminopimelate epimerase n=1 Tax=Anaerotignum lactatifermentans TaxID=160404 RepID=A0ABS2GBF6_9FIRM|nr:hypothetical protein [Anaerotignum lactatifermentans]MBM6830227.1 diaminopimelate epimerase [Anaerotignum lactatifermentans]MBM6878776.1 diaminopimelate epimerase [Anaerotignum lactatifermentans]MBM6951840.1 diaminopimelate epimerase [Anaerotignum lactatifermentans]